jgi:hypothetical protein
MVGIRPRKTTRKPIPTMTIHDRYVLNIEAVSFFKTNLRKPSTAPAIASEIKTIQK